MPKPSRKAASPARTRQLEHWMQQGLALHQSGRGGEAEAWYRQVLAREPRHPAANHLLGLVRLQQGDAGKAVVLISRAVAQRRDDPQYHCNLGVALNAAGEAERAILSFGRALALKPDYPEAYSNRGMALKQLRRPAEAVASYREAIALKPREAGFWLNLGNAQTDLGDLHEAETSYRRALELRAGYPAALSGLALTLEALGRPDEAVAAGEAALAERPDEAEYHRSLGRAYRVSGQLQKAAASYRRALALKPDYAEVHRLLAEMVFHTGHDDDIAAMERLHASTVMGSEERMALGYGLGKAFDDLGDYPRSIEYFLEANASKRRMGEFSLSQAGENFAVIERLFEPALPSQVLDGGFREAAPIFIVGLPRSGKTSLEAMLARHPDVYGAGELRTIARLSVDLITAHDLDVAGARLDGLPPEVWTAFGDEYARYIRSLAGSAAVVVDTMPQNFRNVGFIRLALPNAKIIHCVRSKPEHCIALFQKHFGLPGYEYTCDWDELAGFYALYQQHMALWRHTFPGFVHDLDLAQLEADPETGMRKLLDFCGLTWDRACLELSESEPQLGAPPAHNPWPARLQSYRPQLAKLG